MTKRTSRQLILATVSTRHYDFTAIAATEADALDLLRKAWAVHVHQTGASPALMDEMIADDSVHFVAAKGKVAAGSAFRDGEPLNI